MDCYLLDYLTSDLIIRSGTLDSFKSYIENYNGESFYIRKDLLAEEFSKKEGKVLNGHPIVHYYKDVHNIDIEIESICALLCLGNRKWGCLLPKWARLVDLYLYRVSDDLICPSKDLILKIIKFVSQMEH